MKAALGLALAVTAIHVAASLHYGYFRDELYFIACAHHLAWGYVDQPPLVAFAAWLAFPWNDALAAIRLLPALAAGGTVFAACMLAQRLGGNRFAQIAAGVMAFLLPADLFLGSTLTTSSFEPLTWTLTIWIVAVVLTTPNAGRAWLWLAPVAAFAFYGKYSILLLLLALAAALFISRERTLLRNRYLAVAALAAAAAVLPNVLWQFAHGLPMIEVLHNDVLGRHAFNSGVVFQTADLARNAVLFTLEQFVFSNLFLVPVWAAGLLALFFYPAFRPVRPIGTTVIIVFILALLLDAKSYYIAGIYPALCAAGAVFFSTTRAKYLTCLALPACAAFFIPLTLPVLPVQQLIGYEAHLGVPQARGNPAQLEHPLFAEEFGWDELAQRVAALYNGLPEHDRARTAVFADNYGDAGALDFFGPHYGLPPAFSGQNGYFLWSVARLNEIPPPQILIAVGANRTAELRASFRDVRLVMTYLHPYRWSAEGPTPIYLCRFPVEPLGQVFSRFRWYGA